MAQEKGGSSWWQDLARALKGARMLGPPSSPKATPSQPSTPSPQRHYRTLTDRDFRDPSSRKEGSGWFV